ncbi:MAG: hypothetical protein KKE00_00115 [Proteobacteria bacterium]|nr:hypothetical protein [Pseudomonadota bacterium]MBU1398470.1 hypothetical protein [Pseudomonadota bacterium]MBU1568929.1 hypothetical protein [Pseudomonadota bacterium]
MISDKRICGVNTAVFLIIFSLFFLAAGCSLFSAGTKSNGTDILKPSGSNLIKRIALTKFENNSFIGQDEFEAIFQNNLFAKFEKACPGISLIKPEETGNNFLSGKLPKTASGRIDSFKITEAGREAGINAIITGSLIDIAGVEEIRSFLWFERSKSFARIDMIINIYDVATGTKIYEESIKQHIEIAEHEYDALMGKTPKCVMEFKDTITDALFLIGKSVCKEIKKQPWHGFVISVQESGITISSGENAGLKTGMVFDAYDAGKIISGAGGQKFFMPGQKTGTVKIVNVFRNKAEAVVLTGDNIKAGSVLKIK